MNDIAIGTKPIRQPDAKSPADAVRLAALIFLLATPFFVFIGMTGNQVKEEYDLSNLVEKRRALMKNHDRLALMRDVLLAPEGVTRIAREKLGMLDEDAREWTMGVAPEKAPPAATQAKKDKAPNAAPEKAGAKAKKKSTEKAAAVKSNTDPADNPSQAAAASPANAASAAAPSDPGVAKPSEKASAPSVMGIPLAKPPGGPAPASKPKGKPPGEAAP